MVIIVDLRINETLQTGAVKNRTYQVRGESVYLFFEFTIIISGSALIVHLLSRCKHLKIGDSVPKHNDF